MCGSRERQIYMHLQSTYIWALTLGEVQQYNTSDIVMHLGSNVQIYLLSLSLLFWPTQDSSPAGTIFAEDIEDVQDDYEESQKDSIKV